MTRFLRVVAPALAGILILVRVISVAATTPQNADTYFHLRFGHEFLTSWAPWSPGQVSDLNTRAWTPTQWLGEILFAAVEQLGGLPGLAVLYGVLLIGLLTLWYVAARRAASPLVAVLLAGVALVAAGPSLSLRPQMFSFALATVTVLFWDRARLTGRVPWILVPLCWVWAMLHGMWILGVLVSLACATGLVVERRLTRRALLVPVGMLVVAALTPAGPRLIEAVVVVVSRADLYSEWAAPVFTTTYGIAVLCLLAVAILPPLRKGPAAPYEIAVTIAGVGLAVYSQRTVPVAAAVLLPLCAVRLQALVAERDRVSRPERGLVAGLVLAGVAALLVLAPTLADDPPPAATAFDSELDRLPDGTRLLTDEPTGAIIMWAHPALDVPVHGYGDLYTDEELQAFDDVFALAPGWDEWVEKYRLQHAVLPADLPLEAALVDHGWLVEDRADGLVLLRDGSAVAPTGHSS